MVKRKHGSLQNFYARVRFPLRPQWYNFMEKISWTEKGINDPNPYKSVHAAYSKAFPEVDFPKFEDMKGIFYEADPRFFGKIRQSSSLKAMLVTPASTYYDLKYNKTTGDISERQVQVLHNPMSVLVWAGLVGCGAIMTTAGQKYSREMGLGYIFLVTTRMYMTRRAMEYHEFAHAVHYLNKKKVKELNKTDEEYITEVIAWNSLKHGNGLDRAVAQIYPFIMSGYIIDFAKSGGRKRISAEDERQYGVKYLQGENL